MTPHRASPRLIDGSPDRCDSCGCELRADYVAVGLSFYLRRERPTGAEQVWRADVLA